MGLGELWGVLRGPMRERLTFANIKDLVGAAGLPITELSDLQQSGFGGASKGQLMDAIDGLVRHLDEDAQDRFVSACIHLFLQQDEGVRAELEDGLRRLGWGITGTEPYPLVLQIDVEATNLSDAARSAIETCVRRYRDGDMAGAVTAICGAVDSLTADAYERLDLGDHRRESYHTRVVRTADALEARYREPLEQSGVVGEEQDRLWRDHRQALNGAGYVLASFRRNFSDAHGPEDAPPEIVQRAVDCAIFIIRTLSNLTG